jgi:SAM-dependent methyltransferase
VKKVIAFVKYFFYLGWNWNFTLATTILLHEIRGEKKYRIDSIGVDDLTNSVSQKDLKNASIYQPINYMVAEWLFNQLSASEINEIALLDAGCGKGRVMAMAAWYGFRQVYGFDISPQLCFNTIENIEKIQPFYPDVVFDVQCEDARKYPISKDIGVIFLFNPFNEKIMKPLIGKVLESLTIFPRPLTILYANPEYKNLWVKAGFIEKKAIVKQKWLQGSVLVFNPGL